MATGPIFNQLFTHIKCNADETHRGLSKRTMFDHPKQPPPRPSMMRKSDYADSVHTGCHSRHCLSNVALKAHPNIKRTKGVFFRRKTLSASKKSRLFLSPINSQAFRLAKHDERGLPVITRNSQVNPNTGPRPTYHVPITLRCWWTNLLMQGGLWRTSWTKR